MSEYATCGDCMKCHCKASGDDPFWVDEDDGSTETGRFEHSELIDFCPYCGADLRRKKK